MLLKTGWFIWDAAHHRVFVRCYQRANQAPPVVTSRRMTRSTAELEMAMLASMQKKVVALLGMSGSCDSAFQEDVKAEEVTLFSNG